MAATSCACSITRSEVSCFSAVVGPDTVTINSVDPTHPTLVLATDFYLSAGSTCVSITAPVAYTTPDTVTGTLVLAIHPQNDLGTTVADYSATITFVGEEDDIRTLPLQTSLVLPRSGWYTVTLSGSLATTGVVVAKVGGTQINGLVFRSVRL